MAIIQQEVQMLGVVYVEAVVLINMRHNHVVVHKIEVVHHIKETVVQDKK